MRAFIWKIENPAGGPALESVAALARFTCAPLTRRQPFRCTVARISSGNGEQHMSYTLGQAAKAVGMSKTSILRSIKAGRISAGRDELGQWAIEPCELHRVYPPLADDTGTGNGTEERGVTGGETALAQGPLAAAGGTAGGTRDHGSAEGTLTRAASVVAANAPSSHRSTTVSMGCGPPLWGR